MAQVSSVKVRFSFLDEWMSRSAQTSVGVVRRNQLTCDGLIGSTVLPAPSDVKINHFAKCLRGDGVSKMRRV